MKKEIPVDVLEKFIGNLRKKSDKDSPESRTTKISIADTLDNLMSRNGGVEHYFRDYLQ